MLYKSWNVHDDDDETVATIGDNGLKRLWRAEQKTKKAYFQWCTICVLAFKITSANLKSGREK